jgi:hypothetical protein
MAHDIRAECAAKYELGCAAFKQHAASITVGELREREDCEL